MLAMVGLKECIVVNAIKLLGGSCDVDKLALLIYITDMLSGLMVFSWSMEDNMPISQDLVDVLEGLMTSGLVNIENGVVRLKGEVNVSCSDWAYLRFNESFSNVVKRYGEMDVASLVSLAQEFT